MRWSSDRDMLAAVFGDSDAGLTSIGDSCTVEVVGLDADIDLIAAKGRAAINALDEIAMVVSSRRGDYALRTDALGRRIRLAFLLPDGTRRYHHTTAARIELLRGTDRGALYYLELRPRVFLLSKTEDTRVFQNMTVAEIVAEVLNEHRVPFAFSLARRYRRRRYCLQHEQSDLAFVQRLLAEEGIFYWFEHPASLEELRARLAASAPGHIAREVENIATQGVDGILPAVERIVTSSLLTQALGLTDLAEVMVMADSASGYGTMPGFDTFDYDPTLAGDMISNERHLSDFHVSSSVEPTRSTVRGYDPTRAVPPRPGTQLGMSSANQALADVTSVAVNAASDALGGAADAALGAVPQVAAHGVYTATHAVLPTETGLAQAGVAAGTALLGQALSSVSELGGVVDAAGDVARGLLGSETSSLEIYDHHGIFEEVDADLGVAKMRLEQWRAHHVAWRARSICRRSEPARSFRLRGHPLDELNREFVITEAAFEMYADSNESERVFAGELRGVPANVPDPPATTPTTCPSGCRNRRRRWSDRQ